MNVINEEVRCIDCTHADKYGRACKFGLMFPVLVFLAGKKCENFARKTNEQIEEQLNKQS